MLTIHATSVALDDDGVLLSGPPGSGKSDLALRLMDAGASLVADDYTRLSEGDGALHAAPPDNIAGLMEVRGLGVVRQPYRASVPVRLLVTMAPAHAIPRLPDPSTESLMDHDVPSVAMDAAAPSAVARVRLALDIVTGRRERAE